MIQALIQLTPISIQAASTYDCVVNAARNSTASTSCPTVYGRTPPLLLKHSALRRRLS